MRRRSLIRLSCSVILLTALAAVSACHKPGRVTLNVSAAASLQSAVTEIEAAYQSTGATVDFTNNFGSSGTLARQIEQGAPADLFLSAATEPMDELNAQSLIDPQSSVNIVSNSLVLIAPRDSALKDFQSLTAKPIRRIALGDPASVPAGKYARETLVALGLFDQLKPKLVFARDVRQALTYVETGNADAGLVYSTDALSSSNVRVVATAPDSSHDPIIYPAALLSRSPWRQKDIRSQPDRAFFLFLLSPAGQEIFRKHGFEMAPSTMAAP
jgi:molybdate transport system substrate-binding protein